MIDLGSTYAVNGLTSTTATHSSGSSSSLDMSDFLELMVCEFQNQTIDDTADTSDMLNQLVQMQMIQSITEITEAMNTMYAGSMVGKQVTIGQYDSFGNLTTTTGTITGTGVSNGEQVFFVGDDIYSMSDFLSIGELPSVAQTSTSSSADSTYNGTLWDYVSSTSETDNSSSSTASTDDDALDELEAQIEALENQVADAETSVEQLENAAALTEAVSDDSEAVG
jgi:flagellar basal-body rod modification protein FlgD